QVPILAADLRDAGARRVSGTLGLAVRDRITAKLATLRGPALLGRGSRDRIAPQSWLDHLATLIPTPRCLCCTALRTMPSRPPAAIRRRRRPLLRQPVKAPADWPSGS